MRSSDYLRRGKLLALLLAGGVLAGCSNHQVDTAQLKSKFQTATEGTRQEIDEGIADVNAGNYPAALKVFQHAAFAAKLTQEQSAILTDSIKKVRAHLQ